MPSLLGRTRCDNIQGYLEDSDPRGRTVRSGPGPDARELGRILPQMKEEWPAVFRILSSQNGWLEIEGAGFDPQLNGPDLPKMYSGRGWIAGGGVGIGLQSRLGFAAPSHASPVLVDMRPYDDFDGTRQVRIVGCDGQWVLADWAIDQEQASRHALPLYRKEAVVSERPLVLRAWVTGVCNLQETTCDGVDGSRRATSRLNGRN